MMAPRVGHIFKPLIERFEEKYIPEPNTGCWIWIGATNGHGYGKLSRGHSDGLYAHRVGYELYRGPIPAGMHLDHLCRNPSCVNPDHLEPVTNAQNAQRGRAGAHNSERTHCIRGHAFGDHGYVDSRGGRQCRVCLHMRQRLYYERKRAGHVV